jgi:hypothetical protein
MKQVTVRTLLSLAVLAAMGLLLGGAVRAGGDKDKGFKSLFDGKDLDGWKVQLFGPANEEKPTFTVKNGEIVDTGHPHGYIYTDKSYKNYTIKYDWMYKRPAGLEDEEKFGGNSGLLIHIQGHGKSWPACIEVQGENKTHGKIFAIGGLKDAEMKNVKFYPEKLKEARHKVGEWNTTEFTCDHGKLTTKVNGEVVAEGMCNPDLSGPIGLQSEGAEIHFKNIKIKVLD